MSYAPGAPAAVWAIPNDDLSAGIKLTLMYLWSLADHDIQRDPKPCTVWVPKRTRADGSRMKPVETLLAHVAEATGSKPSTVKKHLTKLNKSGLAMHDGRMIDLTPPKSDGEEMDHEGDGRRQEGSDRHPEGDNGPGPECSVTGMDGAVTEPTVSLTETECSVQSNPPVPPSPPKSPSTEGVLGLGETSRQSTDAPGLFDSLGIDPDGAKPDDGVTTARIRAWWESTYSTIRSATYARWRPKAKIRPLPCTPKRLSSVRARLRDLGRDSDWPTAEQTLTHVVRAAAVNVDSQSGERVPYKDGTYDTMENINPGYWLKSTWFESLEGQVIEADEQAAPSRPAEHSGYIPAGSLATGYIRDPRDG